ETAQEVWSTSARGFFPLHPHRTRHYHGAPFRRKAGHRGPSSRATKAEPKFFSSSLNAVPVAHRGREPPRRRTLTRASGQSLLRCRRCSCHEGPLFRQLEIHGVFYRTTLMLNVSVP